MITRCPHCQTTFALRPAQLRAAGGRVRCGHCGAPFDALEPLEDIIAPDPGGGPTGSTTGDSARPPAAAWSPLPPPASMQPVAGSARTQHPEPAFPELLLDPSAEPGGTGRRAPWWAVGTLALLATLLLQVIWWERGNLSRYPTGRSLLSALCQMSGCQVPLPREPERIGVIRRELRAHPLLEGVLIFGLTMENRAPFPQALPVIQLALYAHSGGPLAVRRFLPRQYLRTGPGQQVMPPLTPVSVALEIVDPGTEVIGFKIELL